MTGLYELLCVIAAAACVVASAAGAFAFRSGFAHPRAWLAIRCAQAAVIAAAAVGAVLFAGAGEPGHGLQYGYTLMAAAVSFVAEQLRLSSAATVLSQMGLAGSEDVAGLEPERQVATARRIALRELGVEVVALAVCAALLLRGAALY